MVYQNQTLTATSDPSPNGNNIFGLNDTQTSEFTDGDKHRIKASFDGRKVLGYDDHDEFKGQTLSHTASVDDRYMDVLFDRRRVFESAFDNVRSSFPSSCTEKYLVFDERQNTKDFGMQCTENSFLYDDQQINFTDDKVCV